VLFIALSVLCSVAVSVVLKLAPRYGVDVRQAIAGNYLVSIALTLALLAPSPGLLLLPAAHPAWRVLLALGVLLPSIFVVMARSVRYAGVVRTDAAQRLSLLLPLIAAFTLFGEAFTWHKGVGMALGLIAIACIVTRLGARKQADHKRAEAWWWPLVVFAGMGVIDILFKRVAQLTGVPFADVLLAAFVLAFVLAALAMVWLYRRGRARWRWRHLSAAVLLGALNFGNIVFYIEAHRHLARDPALVFSSMNIGVIVLATVVGVAWFGERLRRVNAVGLALAVVAVIVLATG
jgi:drug/metabolite transporter (DMT)-like permease